MIQKALSRSTFPLFLLPESALMEDGLVFTVSTCSWRNVSGKEKMKALIIVLAREV